MITDLSRASGLVHQGLWAELRGQAQTFTDGGGPRCLWTLDIAPGIQAPDLPLARAVARIFHELLSNVMRHSQASVMEVRIRATASAITLVVKDNGCGAPPSAFDDGRACGMSAMREQAGQFGGWLYIDSQLGQGTQVILTMPLYQAHSLPPCDAAPTR